MMRALPYPLKARPTPLFHVRRFWGWIGGCAGGAGGGALPPFEAAAASAASFLRRDEPPLELGIVRNRSTE